MFSNHTHLANVSLTLRILPAAFQKVAIERLELSTLALHDVLTDSATRPQIYWEV